MYYLEDEQYAQNLQNQFTSPQSFKKHKELLDKENKNPVDAKLEYLDPTPSIHDLFVKFNKKFFWNKLGMVEVMWSNRMTKCAGICYFDPRQHRCKISLSAPLLTLRPRSDLVETLLHEMIHAYLFMTNNFKDRDDHGPEFHKHMYRINNEAGTDITVYHSFHDEVEYYLRHIWRCDGPCRNRRPYFGFVKRAVNRAPGPYDSWWNEHKQNCNGTFIKISEPEKKPKTVKGKETGTKSKDIRDYLNISQTSKGTDSSTKTNIMTFADLNGSSSNGGLKTNGSTGTFVVTNPKNKSPNATKTPSKTSGSPNVLGGEVKGNGSSYEDIRDVVRNVWAKKFPSVPKPEPDPSPKKLKIECPICEESFSEEEISFHVEECLDKPSSKPEVEEFKLCPVCSSKVLGSEMNNHLETCLKCSFKVEEENEPECNEQSQSVPCPCCYKWFSESEMNSHIDECLTLIALKEELANS